jgi:hypothetical protein
VLAAAAGGSLGAIRYADHEPPTRVKVTMPESRASAPEQQLLNVPEIMNLCVEPPS